VFPAPLVLEDPTHVALLAAELVANRLRARPRLRVILPTGHTPLGMYAALRGHAVAGALGADRATLFQLDEYVGLGPDDPGSYRAYLRRELRDVRFGAVHVLDGAANDPDGECARHQALLDEAPVDLVVLGLGRDGHVAFDEPGSLVEAGVRRVRLHPTTRADAAADFGGLARTPQEALTVGLRTLLAAREVLMIVSGDAKAEALRAMLDGPQGADCPAAWLRAHPRLTVICDQAAARRLSPSPGWRSDRVIIVLGHREPGVSAAERISDESRARLRRAERECLSEPPRAVILTGWSRTPDGVSEAEQMKAEWSLGAVPALLEDGGRDTAANATCSLPLIRAIGDVARVTVVTSAWHVRAPYFFAPYRLFGLRLSFALDFSGPWRRELWGELRAARSMRRRRRRALAAMRLPAEPGRQPRAAPS
jgi:glucosamine-6-phosphate deaminase